VRGADAVAAIVLLESTTGLVAGAAWTQSWAIVRRGHFRIVAWIVVGMSLLALLAGRSAVPASLHGAGLQRTLVLATCVGGVAYLLSQHARTDVPGAVIGTVAAAAGVGALTVTARFLPGWPAALGAVELGSGAALVGAVTNGMLLGHWYLNQPGLEPWALARLTTSALAAVGACALGGIVAMGRLTAADTEGAVLGLPGLGASFGVGFFAVWLLLIAFTGVVVWMARRCVAIRSIQSATGLYYVALLTAAVSEFLVRYLMLNAGGRIG
jgi:hypothetical protein